MKKVCRLFCPPFFGWSAYVPEGLQTSCSWDYMTFTPSVRAYTILLFIFVFFVPLGIMTSCYFGIFQAIRRAGREMQELNCGETNKVLKRMQNEWKMAKIALLVILLFIISWSPYSIMVLAATAGYSHLFTPYMNSVPTVIAKASAIHNPIIYAITHLKYRAAFARYIPILHHILRVKEKDLRSSFSSSSALCSRRPTLTSHCSTGASIGNAARANGHWGKTHLSSTSDTDSYWTESEADGSSVNSPTIGRRVSTGITTDTAIPPEKSSTTTNSGQTSEKMKVADLPVPTISFETDSSDGETTADGKTFLLRGDLKK